MAFNDSISPSQAETGAPAMRGGRSGMVLRMVKNERMGGSVPVWARDLSAAEQVAGRLAEAERTGSVGTHGLDGTLSYHERQAGSRSVEEFTFGDMVDMVNPLHHIPVVGNIYRHISGDDIKPISKIIGGGVFGGAAGAASGLVNVVAEAGTGKDLTENVISFALDEPARNNNTADHPQQRLDRAARRLASHDAASADLPGTAIAFADLGGRREILKEAVAEGRTAGTMPVTVRHVMK